MLPRSLPRRRILIVDDNAVAADGLGRLLALVYGQEVRVVYDGPSALDMAEIVPAGDRALGPRHGGHGWLRGGEAAAGATGMLGC